MSQIAIHYKGRVMRKFYIADLLCYGQVLVELKVMERLTSRETAQLLNYLHATHLRVGVLLNFGNSFRLEWERYVL
jgi:GxxExxY protein